MLRLGAPWLVSIAMSMWFATSVKASDAAMSAMATGGCPPVVPAGRITGANVGVVINDDDPYSVSVGTEYARRRGVPFDRVLRIRFPVKSHLDIPEFEAVRDTVNRFFGPRVQVLALAWREPWAVGCNSITSAISLGYDAQICANGCGPGRRSRYFDSRATRPWTELGFRPSMMLAAPDVQAGLALVDRGFSADGKLRTNARPPVLALFAQTPDQARNVRAGLYPAEGQMTEHGVEIEISPPNLAGRRRYDPRPILVFQTGAIRVRFLEDYRFIEGAAADHLTSSGGRLEIDPKSQMSAIEWIAAGATGSYGTVSEPCNHPQKFPHPSVFLRHYTNGDTLIEAYWKSVAWPAQGVFIGEPLAAPFAIR